MMASEILQSLTTLGVSVEADGTKLRFMPGSLVPSTLVPEIKAHKGELLELLKAPRLVDAPSIWHAQEVARRVEREGVCVFWSDVLQEMIAFVKDENYLPQVPAGIAAFTTDELEHIFPAGNEGLSPKAFRLVYEAKKHGGLIVHFEPKHERKEP